MALTVTPPADADSYVTLIDAETYLTSMGKALTGDDTAKEAALRRATVWVDATYRGRFPGKRLNGRAQTLEWPRADAYDRDGDAIDGIPDEIVQATCEAAVRESAEAGSLSPDVTPGQTKILTQVGEIGWTPTGASGVSSQVPVLTIVDNILAPIIGGKTHFLARA